MNPILKFSPDHLTSGVFSPDVYNYAFILYWNRFYYITDWQYINGSWEAYLTVDVNGEIKDLVARGNGRLDAVSNALKRNLGLIYSNMTYHEHALESGSTSRAVAYVSITDDKGKTYWGAGVHDDIIAASINALVTAINKKIM